MRTGRSRLPRVEIACMRCAKVFEVKEHEATHRRFCSRACQHATDVPRTITVACASCGEDFTLAGWVYYQRRRVGGGRFCSHACAYRASRAKSDNKRAVTFTCQHCGRVFRRPPRRGVVPMYCSLDCSRHAARPRRAVHVTRTCAHCGTAFDLLESVVRNGRSGVYCSRECMGKAYSNGKHPQYKGSKRRIEKSGYVTVRDGGRSRPEHRVVMEAILGRKLTRDEEVHHRNRDKADNRPENLRLIHKLVHRYVHMLDMLAGLRGQVVEAGLLDEAEDVLAELAAS